MASQIERKEDFSNYRINTFMISLFCAILYFAVAVAATGSSACSSGEFQCASGQCILSDWVCDDEYDCDDHSDEQLTHCSNITCPNHYFSCHIGHACIPDAWHCDGHADCINGTDEAGCEVRKCTAEEFQCANSSQCISANWRCDQDDDCEDNSDEIGCERQVCNEKNQFTCNNSRCIPAIWRCDGDNDCIDHSDEDNCENERTPNVGCHGKIKEFMCNVSRECIHWAWRCDGERDCVDGSDESNSMCGMRSCSSDHFQCSDGTCIPVALKCDGEQHCPDGSDESLYYCPRVRHCNPRTQFDCSGASASGEHCIGINKACDGVNDCGNFADEDPAMCAGYRTTNDCAVDNGGCSHGCERTVISHFCTCPPGYALANDSRHCADIDECLTPGVCSQICHNTVGSFKCSCKTGYGLSLTDHRCYAAGHEPLLLFAHRNDIRMRGLRSQHHQLLINGLHSAIAVDFSYREKKLYWSDVSSERIMWVSLSGSNLERTAQVLVSDDISTPDGLALDWIHNNLYWADTGKNTIEVVSVVNPSLRKVLISSDLDEPRAIVVDPRPEQMYMYWSDWGDEAKIERAVLDGTDRQRIISQNVQWPNGLTIDFEENLLYWIDAKLHLIGSCKFDGSQQNIVLMSMAYIKHPFAVSVFEDYIYWTDWELESILKVNKHHLATPGSRNVSNVMLHMTSPMDLHVYHELRQPVGRNVCERAGCNQLCLPGRNGRFQCNCTDRPRGRYVLGGDGKTCIPSGSDITTTEMNTTSSPIVHQLTAAVPVTRIALGIVASFAFVALVAIAVVLVCRHRRNAVKAMNFDNPVYRRTTTSSSSSSSESGQFTVLVNHRGQQAKLSSVMEPLTASTDAERV